jgi:hypothetical protein
LLQETSFSAHIPGHVSFQAQTSGCYSMEAEESLGSAHRQARESQLQFAYQHSLALDHALSAKLELKMS